MTLNSQNTSELFAPHVRTQGFRGFELPSGVHYSPEKFTKHDITLDDPLGLDLSGVTSFLRDRITQDVALCSPDDPLAAIIGEYHYTATHNMLQATLVNALADWRDEAEDYSSRDFIWCEEGKINFAEWMIVHDEVFGLDVPEELHGQLHKCDPHSKVMLQLLNHFKPFPSADARACKHKALLDKNVSFALTDMAGSFRLGREYISPKDTVIHSIQEKFSEAFHDVAVPMETSNIPGLYPEGIAWRNGSMAIRGLSAAKDHNAPILVQHCGVGHLLGNISGESYSHWSIDTSLTMLHENQAVKTLPIFLSDPAGDSIPEKMLENKARYLFPQTIIVRGLSDKKHETRRGEGIQESLDFNTALRKSWSNASTVHWIKESETPDAGALEIKSHYERMLSDAKMDFGLE